MIHSKNILKKQQLQRARLSIGNSIFYGCLLVFCSVTTWADGQEQANISNKKTKPLQNKAANGLLGKPSFSSTHQVVNQAHEEKINQLEQHQPQKTISTPPKASVEQQVYVVEPEKIGQASQNSPEMLSQPSDETTTTISEETSEIEAPPYDASNYAPYTADGNIPEIDQTIQIKEDDEDQSNLWDRVKDGFGMASLNSKLVKLHEQNFSKHPQSLSDMIHQSDKYLYHIVEEVKKRGMPTEIALIPIIESAYNPNAGSRSRAAGLWQIIPSTGKLFGLKQNWWVDNRKNITDATDAALTYLERLKKQFGSWDLALAAYNAGQGTVGRAIKKNKSLGKSTNFSDLQLPPETRNYVPKLQAIKNIILNPKKFGVDIQPIKDRPYFTQVEAPKQIDTALAAELAGISNEEFDALNPSFNRPIIASSSTTHILLLPVESAQKFQDNLANYDKPLVTWQPYTIHPGEKLSSVADMFDIKLKTLSEANQMPATAKVVKPVTILVPNNAIAANNKYDNTITNHDVNTDSSNYLLDSNVDISQVQRSENIDLDTVNALKNNHLALAENQVATATKQTKVKSIHYTIKKGDTLSEVAQKFNVSTAELMRINRLKTKTVKIGQKIIISLNP